MTNDELRQRLDECQQEGERKRARIRELEAEVERLSAMTPDDPEIAAWQRWHAQGKGQGMTPDASGGMWVRFCQWRKRRHRRLMVKWENRAVLAMLRKGDVVTWQK